MSPKLQRSIVPLVAFAGLTLLPVVSFADGGGEYDIPSGLKYEPAVEAHAPTCAEATRAAWFKRQLEISDGDVSPNVSMPAECNRNVLAQAGSDESE
ncbi:MAG TPA: hypothetical protein VFP44_00280 [Usitatibacter sp.]|nr:hypothetical protein [Usitatibacter sp.]